MGKGEAKHIWLFWKLFSFGRGRLPWGWESSCCYHWLIWVGWPVRWCLRGCWHCSNISLSVIQSCYRGEGGGGWFWELLFCWWGCLAWSSCRLAGASWYDGAAQQVSNRLCPLTGNNFIHLIKHEASTGSHTPKINHFTPWYSMVNYIRVSFGAVQCSSTVLKYREGISFSMPPRLHWSCNTIDNIW